MGKKRRLKAGRTKFASKHNTHPRAKYLNATAAVNTTTVENKQLVENTVEAPKQTTVDLTPATPTLKAETTETTETKPTLAAPTPPKPKATRKKTTTVKNKATAKKTTKTNRKTTSRSSKKTTETASA